MQNLKIQFITPTYDDISKFDNYYRLILSHDNLISNFPYCEEIFIKLLDVNNKYSIQELNEMMYNMFYSEESRTLYVITPETHEHIKCMLFHCWCECQYCKNNKIWRYDTQYLYLYSKSKDEEIQNLEGNIQNVTKFIDLDSILEIDLTKCNDIAAIFVDNINIIKDWKGFNDYNGLIIVKSTQNIDKYKHKLIRYNNMPDYDFSWILDYNSDFRYNTKDLETDILVFNNNNHISYMYDFFNYMHQFNDYKNAVIGLFNYKFRTIINHNDELLGWIFDDKDFNYLTEEEMEDITNYSKSRFFGSWVNITQTIKNLRNYYSIIKNISLKTLDDRFSNHFNYVSKLKIGKNISENNHEILMKNKTSNKLDQHSLIIISKYFNSAQDFINLTKTCSEYNEIIPSIFINPFPLKTEQDFKIFNSINAYNIYSNERLKVLPSYNKYIINYKNPLEIDNDDIFYLLFHNNPKFQFKFECD